MSYQLAEGQRLSYHAQVIIKCTSICNYMSKSTFAGSLITSRSRHAYNGMSMQSEGLKGICTGDNFQELQACPLRSIDIQYHDHLICFFKHPCWVDGTFTVN